MILCEFLNWERYIFYCIRVHRQHAKYPPRTSNFQSGFNHIYKLTCQFGTKYPKATECLEKGWDVLLTFYDFPAEHWRHIRTTNPIESTFSTVRLITAKVGGCFSSLTVLTIAFQLFRSVQKRWIRLHHPERLAEVIRGINFVDGIIEKRIAA